MFLSTVWGNVLILLFLHVAVLCPASLIEEMVFKKWSLKNCEAKEARIYSGEKTASSISCVGKTEQLYVKQWNYKTP